MGITTDSEPIEAPKDPNKSSIVALYKLFASPADVALMEDQFRSGGVGYGDFKKRLFAIIWETFAPYRERREALSADPATIDSILKQGAEKARSIALPTIESVRNAMGLR